LALNARGFTTGNITAGDTTFEVRFDFVAHALEILTVDGRARSLPLAPMSVADFYRRFLALLAELGVVVTIDPKPQEVEDVTPCDVDEKHCSYDANAANRCLRVFARVERVFQKFRSSFCGKSSPVQLFWGSFDLSEVRYSGRPFVGDRGPNRLMRVSNDEEHFAAGFWPGNAKYPKAAFYAYAAPSPAGFADARVQPSAARFDRVFFGEFMLDYDDVVRSKTPDDDVLAFLHSTYAAAANLGGWDRAFLERPIG
jgi:hypothetical protein